MLIYKVKINIDPAVEVKWLNWMKTIHVPAVIATGLINSFQVLKSDQEEFTYHFHYVFDREENFDQYQKNYAPALKKHPQQTFPNQFTATRKILKRI